MSTGLDQMSVFVADHKAGRSLNPEVVRFFYRAFSEVLHGIDRVEEARSKKKAEQIQRMAAAGLQLVRKYKQDRGKFPFIPKYPYPAGSGLIRAASLHSLDKRGLHGRPKMELFLQEVASDGFPSEEVCAYFAKRFELILTFVADYPPISRLSRREFQRAVSRNLELVRYKGCKAIEELTVGEEDRRAHRRIIMDMLEQEGALGVSGAAYNLSYKYFKAPETIQKIFYARCRSYDRLYGISRI